MHLLSSQDIGSVTHTATLMMLGWMPSCSAVEEAMGNMMAPAALLVSISLRRAVTR